MYVSPGGEKDNTTSLQSFLKANDILLYLFNSFAY